MPNLIKTELLISKKSLALAKPPC